MSKIDQNRINKIFNFINKDEHEQGMSHYELDAVLGAGGMGAVFLARLEPLGVLRALKVLCVDERASDSEIDAAGKRFLREARIMGNLRHPAAIKALDYQVLYCKFNGQRASFPFLIYAMEPCLVNKDELPRICDNYHIPCPEALEEKWPKGQEFVSLSLQSFLDARTTFPEKTVARFARELIAVLRSAHEQTFKIGNDEISGIVHRDVKPSNILVGADGRLRLTDFGISKTASAPVDKGGELTSSKAGCTMSTGTPGYAAPEQYFSSDSSNEVRKEADYYSLGAVLFQLLTGNMLGESWVDPSTFTKEGGAISRHWDILLRGMTIPWPDMRLANPDLLDYEFAEIEEGRG